MRRLFLALLAANLLYAGWALLSPREDAPGSGRREEAPAYPAKLELASEYSPAGGREAAGPAGTPSAFNMAMDSVWLERYYEQNPERRASYVFAIDPSMPFNQSGYAGIATFDENPAYERRDVGTGAVFLRGQD